MLNSERIHTSHLVSGADSIELIDPDRKATYLKPLLHLSTSDSPGATRVVGSRRRRMYVGVKSRLAAYAECRVAIDVAPDRAASRVGSVARAVKRAVDVIGALVLLAVFLPVFCIVAALVLLTSRGPVLFRQRRLGENGVEFTCLKFRTMVADAETLLSRMPELGQLYTREFKIKDDPRVTAIGRFLRKSSLDELPQLLNVLQGSMSLVGPRPIVPLEIEKYGAYGPKLLSVKPGLTGVWQVCGRSDTSYDERIVMDMFYVDTNSVGMDMTVLCSTVLSVLKCRGAY